MPHQIEQEKAIDTGLVCLVMLAKLQGIPAEEEQLKHEFGLTGAMDTTGLLRAAKFLKLKARETTSSWERLGKTTLPAIGIHQNGHYFIIAKADDERVLIHDPLEKRPLTLPRAIFEQAWSGKLIQITQRALLNNEHTSFDIKWFIPVIFKYKKIFTEVLVASFFLQLFALVSPLFFQVVVDKVLVHQGLFRLNGGDH